MVVIATRQPGQRPETIRTRLARFMPTRITSGWSVAWSAANSSTPRRSPTCTSCRWAEHLGCYGSAVAHALAQAELTAERLRLTADCATADNGLQTITIEVRAEIDGPEVDQELFDAIVRRAEPPCPVLKGLATQAILRLIAIVEAPRSLLVAGGFPVRAGEPTGGLATGTGAGETMMAAREARRSEIEPVAGTTPIGMSGQVQVAPTTGSERPEGAGRPVVAGASADATGAAEKAM